MILTVMLAVLVAVAIKIVGALLITAMLIIPAAAARAISRTPEWMAVLAVAVGLLAVLAGLFGSFTGICPQVQALLLQLPLFLRWQVWLL